MSLYHPITQTPVGGNSSGGTDKNLIDAYKGRRVLVTGGLGFIGSNLTIALAQTEAVVTVVDAQVPGCGSRLSNLDSVRDRVALSIIDIADTDRMRPLVESQEIIINMAGEVSHTNSMRDPRRDLGINCGAQVRFLDLCRSAAPKATIVYASSRQVYGRPMYLPLDEEHPVRPVDYNGVHKHATEHYHYFLRNQFDVRTICLRLGNIYGPRQAIHQDCRGFIDTFIRVALEGGQISIFGDGRQLRGMMHVSDAVDAFLRAGLADAYAAHVYNVGHPEPVSLLQIAETLSALTGCPKPKMVPFPAERKVIDIGDVYQNPEKFCRDFGWAPRVDLQSGLRDTLRFFQGSTAQTHANAHPVS